MYMYEQIAIKKYIVIKMIKIAIVSQVRNSIETKLGQSKFSAFGSDRQQQTTSEVHTQCKRIGDLL